MFCAQQNIDVSSLVVTKELADLIFMKAGEMFKMSH